MNKDELIDLKTAYVGEVLIPKAIEKLRGLENLSTPYLEALAYIEKLSMVNKFHSSLSIDMEKLKTEIEEQIVWLYERDNVEYGDKRASYFKGVMWGIENYIRSFTSSYPEVELVQARAFLVGIGLIDEFKLVAELYEKSKVNYVF